VFGQTRVTAVLVVDVSGSMSGGDGVTTRLEQAKSAAIELLDALPGGSRVALWTVTDTVRELIPEPTGDLNLLRRSIEELVPTDGGSDLSGAVSRGIAVLRRGQGGGGGGRRELLVVTDGQRLAFAGLPAIRRELEAAADEVVATFVLVGAEETQNLSVSELRQASGIAAADRPLRFMATVSNHGVSEARDIRVVLREVNGEGAAGGAERAGGMGGAPVDEAVIDSIPGGESRSVSLFARLSPSGFHAVRAEIPADRVPFDDRRTAAIRVVDRVRVLLVDGDPGAEPREAQSFFLRQALVPATASEAASWFVSADVATAADLLSARLDDYDAVVLAGLADVSPAMAESLAGYLRRGGGVIWFPGPGTRAELVNRELVERLRVLPASMEPPRGDLSTTRPSVTLSPRNLEHPIAAIWSEASSGNLTTAGFFRVFPLRPAEVPAVAAGQMPPPEGLPRVVLLFSDGTPAVMERTYGQGRVVMFAFPATTQWGDLPVRPGIFVPLLYRTLGSVLSRQDEQLNVTVGRSFVYRPPTEWLGREAAVVVPGVAERPAESVRVELVDGAPLLRFEGTDRAGTYRLLPPGGPTDASGGAGGDAGGAGGGGGAAVFAVQTATAESLLPRLTLTERAPLAEVATVTEYGGEGTLSTVTRTRAGAELFALVAALVVLLAVSETAMAFWFSKPK
jgi:hypothetical protein